RRRKMHRAGALPDTILADITGRDSDGELIATPDEWAEEAAGTAPTISVDAPRRARDREPAAGIGDRVLLRLQDTHGDDTPYRGRVIRILDRPNTRVLGMLHAAPGGGGRIEPIDKKQLGKELTVPAHAAGGAQDGDLVSVEVSKSTRLVTPHAQ